MNFLQLVQMTKQEGGITGAVPTTLLNQVAEINRVAGWVNAAWMDIQTLHTEWEFMRTAFSFNTVAQQYSYTPVQCGVTQTSNVLLSNLGNWKRDSFRKYLLSGGVAGEMILPFIPYDTYRDMYQFGTQRTNYAPPVVFSIDPSKNLVLGNVPDAIYNINGEYFAKPLPMVADTDTPRIPDEYHTAIVWKALAHYGQYEAAQEAVQRGVTEYSTLLSRMEADQLPKITWGPPLA